MTNSSAALRARDLGWSPGHYPTGPANAITDVPGVLVGHVTLHDPDIHMHTGVTAILPHAGNLYLDRVPAAYFRGNGYGKIMGTSQVIELGELETPILLTNTLNVADAAIGSIGWTLKQPGNETVGSVNAVVGETNDGRINDIRKRFIKPEHAIKAIENAKSGPVAEGNVGAGAGTVAFGFKAGIGTSSRQLETAFGTMNLGVLVQANYGGDLHIMGQAVGRQLTSLEAQQTSPDGSVMIIIATDAPLSDRNLERLAKRSLLGIGRTGGIMSNGSGDYVLAFSSSEKVRRHATDKLQSTVELPNNAMTPFFEAVIEATEEAVYNALVAAETVKGFNQKTYRKLPVETIQTLISR